jgi:cytochrome c oxidase subunit II
MLRAVVRAGRCSSIRAAKWGLIALAILLLAGCGKQDTLSPAGKPERHIAKLFWIMMTGAWIGFAIIIGLLVLGYVRRKREGFFFGRGEKAATGFVIGIGIVTPIVLLVTLFVYSDIFVLKSTAAPTPGSTQMTIDVVGHQWWWEVRYEGTKAVTANEIHIPTGSRVLVRGTTDDVIHSFWVPELNKKIDLVPGRVNTELLATDTPGTYRGQCAEFCGIQHANMGVEVVAQRPAAFRRWLDGQARPAPQPKTALERRGEQFFVSHPCAGCHTISGTKADGKIGPDLTHFVSRRTIAALTVPNDATELAQWIRQPSTIKPGVKMPSLPLDNADVSALVAYLESLK